MLGKFSLFIVVQIMVYISFSVPSAAPPNVTAQNTSSTSILLEWDLMPEDDRNGILLGYVVYYNRTTGTETSFVHRSTERSVEITNLERYTIYQFEMTAFTSIGQGNRSTVIYCTTDEDSKSFSAKLSSSTL